MNAAPRPKLAELLEKHKNEIATLKAVISAEDAKADPVMGEDLFVLKFILSAQGDMEKSEDALQKTVRWRKEKATWLQAAREGVLPPEAAKIPKYMIADIHKCTAEGDAMYVIRGGLSNAVALTHEVPVEVVVDYLMYKREQVCLLCDANTRKTGRLCKMITVNDFNFGSMNKMNSKFSYCLKTTAKMSETYYPQLLDTAVMINVPSVMKVVFRTLASFMPRKYLDKVKVCPGRTLHDDISKCPFVRARMALADVPSFLGGTCHCKEKGGCVPGVANDQKESNLEVDREGMSRYTIAAGAKYEVFLNLDEPGATVAYAFQVEKGTLTSGGVTVGAVIKDDNSELTVLQAEKYKPDQGMLRGEFTCPQAGTCVVTFANNSSMWSRSIKYSLGAVSAGGMLGAEGAAETADAVQTTEE